MSCCMTGKEEEPLIKPKPSILEQILELILEQILELILELIGVSRAQYLYWDIISLAGYS